MCSPLMIAISCPHALLFLNCFPFVPVFTVSQELCFPVYAPSCGAFIFYLSVSKHHDRMFDHQSSSTVDCVLSSRPNLVSPFLNLLSPSILSTILETKRIFLLVPTAYFFSPRSSLFNNDGRNDMIYTYVIVHRAHDDDDDGTDVENKIYYITFLQNKGKWQK